MDQQHAIPQDVTGFQFKLIGSMTVKQFGYVAVGVISAVVLYYLPLHFALAFLIKALLIPAFGASGFIIAFLPIDGRPVDVMAGNFIKAMMSPNQYVYHKVGYTFSFSNVTVTKAPTTATQTVTTHKQQQMNSKELQLQMYLQNSQKKIRNALDEKEFAFLKTVATTATPAMPTTTQTALHPVAVQQTHIQSIQPKPMPPITPITKPAAPPVATTITHTAIPAAAPMVQKPAAITPTPIQSVQQSVQSQPVLPPLQNPTVVPTAAAPVQTPPAMAPLPSVKTEASLPPTPAPLQPNGQTTDPTTGVGTLIQQEHSLEQQLEVAKNDEKNQHAPQGTATAHEKVVSLEQQIQKIHAEKLRLEQELVRLKQQQEQASIQAAHSTASQNTTNLSASIQKPAANTQFSIPQVKSTPQPPTKNTMVPHIPDTPNILVGLVKDSRGNVLPHILVEVKDKDGNPVRAFKTNALGQFASATPLANGMYTIELEDPKRQNTFDVIQVIANNKIILPLEIISHDAREQLRRELFN
jgi:hypothetical protein